VGGAVGRDNAEFCYREAWVVLACPGSCKEGATDLELLEHCGLVPVPSLFSAIHLAQGFLERVEDVLCALSGAGAIIVRALAEANPKPRRRPGQSNIGGRILDGCIYKLQEYIADAIQGNCMIAVEYEGHRSEEQSVGDGVPTFLGVSLSWG